MVKKLKATICPPAIAGGIETQAEVEPFRRPRGSGVRKLPSKFPKLKKRKRRKSSYVEPETKEPKLPNHRPWTVHGRRILNAEKDHMRWMKERRKKLNAKDKKRLEAAPKRELKKLRARLHDLIDNPDLFPIPF